MCVDGLGYVYVCKSYVVLDECDEPPPWEHTDGACSMAVPAMSTRPRTSVLRMHSTHPAIKNANHR